MTVHATAIALGAHAALIRGPSGSGKSDLALRCIAMAAGTLLPQAAKLVADDRVCLRAEAGRIHLEGPTVLAGQLEVRGLGIVPVGCTDEAAWLALIVDLRPEAYRIERLPETTTSVLLGVPCPTIELHPFEASSPIKLLLALAQARLNAIG
jgi:HPr kinase/phosphorylase